MYECGNGYLESWTFSQLRQLRQASKTAGQVRAARLGRQQAAWPREAIVRLGERLVVIGQRLQQTNRYQIAPNP